MSIEWTAHSVLTFYMANHFNTNSKLFSSCVDVMRTTARKKIRDKFIIALQLQKKTSNWISCYFKSTILYQAHITKFPLMIGKIWIKSWSGFFLVSYYYIPFFCYCCPRLIWFIRLRKCGNFSSSQQHNIIVAVVWFCCFSMKVFCKVTKDF